MIAITFALPEESKDLRRALENSRLVRKGVAGPLLTGSLQGANVAIAHTGIGREAALQTARDLLRDYQPSLLISSGFAGGLSRELRVGDVVFDAAETRSTAPNTTGLFAGRITTSEHVIETPAGKIALREATGALAVDMESSAISAACRETGTPFVCIRGISDAVSDRLPVPMPHWFDLEKQRPRPLGLVLFLLSHPSRILPFGSFLRGLPLARRAMTDAILAFVERSISPGANRVESAPAAEPSSAASDD